MLSNILVRSTLIPTATTATISSSAGFVALTQQSLLKQNCENCSANVALMYFANRLTSPKITRSSVAYTLLDNRDLVKLAYVKENPV